MNVQVKTKLHLWWSWIQIAIRSAAQSKTCRYKAIKSRSFESEESARLSCEFQHAMTAIVAVAFAMEALKRELKDTGHILDESYTKDESYTNLDNPTAGFHIAHRIRQAFVLPEEMAEALPGRIHDLFQLRHDCVHFDSEVQEGTQPHPSGTKTANEMTSYTAEESLSAIQIAVDVLRTCATAVESGEYEESVEAVACEIPGVLDMCLETIEAVGLKGIK